LTPDTPLSDDSMASEPDASTHSTNGRAAVFCDEIYYHDEKLSSTKS